MSERELSPLFSGLKFFALDCGPAKTNRPVVSLIFAKEISAGIHRFTLPIFRL
jgi:hypothetical protein